MIPSVSWNILTHVSFTGQKEKPGPYSYGTKVFLERWVHSQDTRSTVMSQISQYRDALQRHPVQMINFTVALSNHLKRRCKHGVESPHFTVFETNLFAFCNLCVHRILQKLWNKLSCQIDKLESQLSNKQHIIFL